MGDAIEMEMLAIVIGDGDVGNNGRQECWLGVGDGDEDGDTGSKIWIVAESWKLRYYQRSEMKTDTKRLAVIGHEDGDSNAHRKRM